MKERLETETIDKLYLELSQVTRAVNARELGLIDMVKEASQLLRSARTIAKRRGEKTNWDTFEKSLERVLKEQHKIMYPKKGVRI